MATPLGERKFASGVLAFMGGLLMAVSGFYSRSLLYDILGLASGAAKQYLNGLTAATALIVIVVLQYIISLGGITVAFGGVAILLGRVGTGRLLIALGGAASIIGALITFGLTVWGVGLSGALVYLTYWVGLALAIIGRRASKWV